MHEEPPSGRIVIEYWRIADAPTEGSDWELEFDWRVTPEPTGELADDEISRLLGEISKRF
jgi:hypothetical protein